MSWEGELLDDELEPEDRRDEDEDEDPEDDISPLFSPLSDCQIKKSELSDRVR